MRNRRIKRSSKIDYSNRENAELTSFLNDNKIPMIENYFNRVFNDFYHKNGKYCVINLHYIHCVHSVVAFL